jgi:hypothetical protein
MRKGTMAFKRSARRAWIAAAAAPVLLTPAHVQSASAVPDFAGPWGRTTLDYEPPRSGPGPILNTAHRLERLVGDYTNPILQPWAREVVKRHSEISARGDDYPTPSGECWPEQPPYALRNIEMQVVQGRNEVLFLYMTDHHVRHVRLNAAHPAHVTPSWMGDSIGHYEGDTLVVDTIGVKVAPISVLDRYGTPHSDELHLVERYRLIDGEKAKEAAEANERRYGRTGERLVDFDYKGKGLQVQFTVEDPKVFTEAWSALVTWRRAKPWEERVCAENTRLPDGSVDPEVPHADKPDF